MIDEEYYKLAADELDTPDLKPEVWERACKLASDDKDEAQLLYINLRVEEMLGNDSGEEHEFTTNHASNDPMISSVDKFDALQYEDHVEEFDISDQIEAAEATDYDEVLSFDATAADNIGTEEGSLADMSDVEVLADDDIPDFETIVDPNDASDNREYTTVMDSSITNDMLALAPENEDNINAKSADGNQTDTQADSTSHDSQNDAFTPPEAHKAALLAKDFERQAMDMGEIEPGQEINAETGNDSTNNEITATTDEQYSESFSDALNNDNGKTQLEASDDSFDSLSSGSSNEDDAASSITTEVGVDSKAAATSYEDPDYDPLDDLLNNLSNHSYDDSENNEVSDVQKLDATSSDTAEPLDAKLNNDSMDGAASDVINQSAGQDTTDTSISSDSTEAETQNITDDQLIESSGVENSIQAEEPSADTALAAQQSKTTQQGDVTNDHIDIDSDTDEILIETDDAVASGGFMVFSRDGKHKLVKQGTSLPAMFMTFPWLLSKTLFGTALTYAGLWLVSIAGLLVGANLWLNANGAAALSTKLFTAGFALLVIIGLFYLPYRFGNSWVADKMQKKGFQFNQAIDASSRRKALKELKNIAS